ncbi:LANO_0F14422g1_1 [Lachancea nothofagi CBS 11611]|uniref:LANO_0F14422g1_1 n=1 Tax=Lachancea nothofagi CBS 11611 TaxID=1266666 RepID=A0A1G4KCA0_9SACH|nr:LANO_0F14422g1_1 [Lachancea nothofagi CBS 11611]
MEEQKLAASINSQIEQDKGKHDKPGNQNKKKKKSSKGSRVSTISAEHIAEVRAQREAAKKVKRDEMLARGLDPDCPPDLQFIRRPMLSLTPKETPSSGFTFRLMTYNCLAQALIRRKLFPTSGNALKWFKRSQVLLNEFKYYAADVQCLQEVDYIQYQSFWKEEFAKMGYDSQFHRHGTKNHGIAIVWKREMFDMTDKMLIDYDKEPSGNIEPRTTTKNVGLVLALNFTTKVLNKFPDTKKRGILVGTTHLFWHPFGTFERTRQCYVLLKKMKEFENRVKLLQGDSTTQENQWTPFFCGDFNSQPFDTPYLSMSSKPVTYKDRAKTVIECSTSYTFSKARDGEECGDEEGGNIEKNGNGQPQHPVPSTFDSSREQKDLVESMSALHNALDMRAISLYSVGYKHVHVENSGLNNDFNEPEISNWAETWNGLLDYILFIKKWDFTNKNIPEEINAFECENGLKIKSLLRMPAAKEMPSHGQPHEGEYGSDHLSMVCDLELKM